MTKQLLPEPVYESPALDQVEVSLFGPGVGECSVIHLGGGRWMIIDSCQGRGRIRPACLEYFDKLGVDPGGISLIVASHWHDDHIKGISRLYESATAAEFCIAAAIRPHEFLALTGAQPNSKFSSGADELAKVALIAAKRGVAVRTVAAGTRLIHEPAGPVNEVWALSPSALETQLGREHLAALLPTYQRGSRRLSAQDPNDTSIVIYVQTVAGPLLFGGDLEHQVNSRSRGWHAVMDLEAVPNDPSAVFKVPHHGSINAYCPEVWDNRVADDAFAIITPFDRGATPVPRQSDRARLRTLTTRGYLTSDKRDPPQPRDRATAKTIREATRAFVPQTLEMGHVQLRSSNIGWTVAGTDQVRQI